MRSDELARELADFWFSAMAGAGWEERLRILKDIHAQLEADIETRAEYEAVAPRFVAEVIERLGSPPLESDAQAAIYVRSANERHRDAARAWLGRADAVAPSSSRHVRDDRRRFPRQPVDAVSEIWVEGHRARCQLVDLSAGGARVRAWEPAPSLGTAVRLVLPGSGVRDATVVFRNSFGVGLRFAEQSAA